MKSSRDGRGSVSMSVEPCDLDGSRGGVDGGVGGSCDMVVDSH
jgi:hypothetical protein